MTDGGSGRGLTRREFLRRAGVTSLAVLAGWETVEAGKKPLFAAEKPAARVVLVRNERVLRADGAARAEVVREMVFEGVQSLTGKENAREAWRSLFASSDMVGMKFSRCGWMRVPTNQEVIDAVAAGLGMVPVPDQRIQSKDYGLPAAECTALVNATSLKAHPLTGFAAAIKNYINLHPEPSSFHEEKCGKLGEVWLRPEVKGKTRLVVLDLLTPYFGAGPQIDPRYRADYRGVLVATDPVAADAVALHLCQKMRDRHRGKSWPISPPPLFLAAADEDYGLGTADPGKIKLVKLGWEEGALI